MSLWTRFTSWLEGWPEGAPRKDHRSDKNEDMLFREQEILAEKEKGLLCMQGRLQTVKPLKSSLRNFKI